MKKKYFIPIIILAVIIVVESLVVLFPLKNKKVDKVTVDSTGDVPTTEETKNEDDAVGFEWYILNDGKVLLKMTANREVFIDALDLYVGYKGVQIKSMSNANVLPEPSFKTVSKDKSLAVANYLISADEGFHLIGGQSIDVATFNVTGGSATDSMLFIDKKTQVVENRTSNVLKYSGENLIIQNNLK